MIFRQMTIVKVIAVQIVGLLVATGAGYMSRSYSARIWTYEPGASSIAASLPLPGWRAGTCPPP